MHMLQDRAWYLNPARLPILSVGTNPVPLFWQLASQLPQQWQVLIEQRRQALGRLDTEQLRFGESASFSSTTPQAIRKDRLGRCFLRFSL